MPANVTIPPMIAAATETTSAPFKTTKEKPYVIKKVQSLCSFLCDSSPGSSRHPGSGIRIDCHGSVRGRPPRDMARAGHGPQLPDGRGAKDLPGHVCIRQRGYAHRDD